MATRWFLRFWISLGLFVVFNQSTVLANDSTQWNLLMDNSNFVVNNEYFNQIVEGYTLIGYWLHPQLSYRINDAFFLKAGLHLEKYSGIEQFSKKLPTFTVGFRAGETLTILLGSLQNDNRHGMPDPLLHHERQYTQAIENGVQFIRRRPNYFSDVWVDWEQFIFHGSPYQEVFTAGINIKPAVGNRERNRFTFPLQVIGTHRGGQIDAAPGYVETLINMAGGVGLEKNLPNMKLNLQSQLFSFVDASPIKELPYIAGRAIYSTIKLSRQKISVEAAHWYGTYFVSARGNPMFSSISTYKDNYTDDDRALAILRFNFTHNIYTGARFSAFLTTYTDLFTGNTEFAFGVDLNFGQNWDLKPRWE